MKHKKKSRLAAAEFLAVLKHYPIRNLYFHQRQKEAAEWQRKKERLRPRRR